MPWIVEVKGKAAKTIIGLDKPIRNRLFKAA